MTQLQLERAVAQITGESLATVRRRGFGIVDRPTLVPVSQQDAPQTVDWDALDETRYRLLPK